MAFREQTLATRKNMLPNIIPVSFSTLILLVAGFIRGYSGFGSGMIAVLGLSLVFPPARMVPVILLLEVIASASLLPGIWKLVDRSSLGWLSLGALLGTPAGAYLLASIPARMMRIAIAVTVMVLIILFWLRITFRKGVGKPAIVSVGVISGLLNGSAAIGGPPVILFFFSSSSEVAVSRASLIAFFLGTDLLATGMCATQGLITPNTLLFALAMTIPLACGLMLGRKTFIRTDPEVFRRRVLQLLMLLSIAALGHSLFVP